MVSAAALSTKRMEQNPVFEPEMQAIYKVTVVVLFKIFGLVLLYNTLLLPL